MHSISLPESSVRDNLEIFKSWRILLRRAQAPNSRTVPLKIHYRQIFECTDLQRCREYFFFFFFFFNRRRYSFGAWKVFDAHGACLATVKGLMSLVIEYFESSSMARISSPRSSYEECRFNQQKLCPCFPRRFIEWPLKCWRVWKRRNSFHFQSLLFSSLARYRASLGDWNYYLNNRSSTGMSFTRCWKSYVAILNLQGMLDNLQKRKEDEKYWKWASCDFFSVATLYT